MTPNPPEKSIAYARLEDQLEWYEKKSAWNKQVYKQMKMLSLVTAVSIPVVALKGPGLAAAILGALIALLEGLQHLNQYQENWLSYRSTAEALKHEKFLFLSESGPYLKADNPTAILAERVEAVVSDELINWTVVQTQAGPTENQNKKF